MVESPTRGSANALDERLIERTEAIPASPPAGTYVVVDTLHFSNTVIELLANGATHVHVTERRGDEFDYKAANPAALIGGGSTEAYEPTDGYDFYNSPSYVQRLDVAGRPTSMTSSNGGRAVNRLRERASDADVYVGSPMNAAALGRHLRETADRVHIVSAGSGGDVAVEDHVGAALISRHVDGLPVSETERDLFRRQVRHAKGPGYVESHERRRADVLEYALDFDSRTVVPRLEGDALVDVGAESEESAAAGQTAD